MIPPFTKKAGNNAWSTEDIQKMLRNSCSNRDRAFIHILASTGCRIGALEALKWKNVLPMKENCRTILFYEGSNEEYWGFLTPEACSTVDEYIDERRRDGEIIDQESPLFRSAYQIGAQKVKPMSTASAKMIALRLAHSVKRNKVGRRYDTMSAHGFRKRFNTILKSNDKANASLAEKLMGHRGVFALDGAYLKPSVDILFNEFKKHIHELTISDSERKSMKIVELEEKNGGIDMKEIKSKLETHDALIESFSGIVDSLRKITGNTNLLKSLEIRNIQEPKRLAETIDLGRYGDDHPILVKERIMS